MPSQLEFQRELAAYDEKSALAEMEEARAKIRTLELRYAKQRFVMDMMTAMVKAEQEEAMKGSPNL